MPRILAVDYGGKRCGIAETDDLQIIASPLDTVPTAELLPFLRRYAQQHKVGALVVGLPMRHSGEASDIEAEIAEFIAKFAAALPLIPVHRINEMYTSKMAMQAMVAAGAGKKQRREKGNLDKVSAAIILQHYLEQQRNRI